MGKEGEKMLEKIKTLEKIKRNLFTYTEFKEWLEKKGYEEETEEYAKEYIIHRNNEVLGEEIVSYVIVFFMIITAIVILFNTALIVRGEEIIVLGTKSSIIIKMSGSIYTFLGLIAYIIHFCDNRIRYLWFDKRVGHNMIVLIIYFILIIGAGCIANAIINLFYDICIYIHNFPPLPPEIIKIIICTVICSSFIGVLYLIAYILACFKKADSISERENKDK